MKSIKELADLIEANPDCEFVIDNDCWWINASKKEDDSEIANHEDFEDGDWYSGGNCYGAGLAAAMVELLNRRGFKIKAGAC
jgi:hypothetical protein